MSLLALFYQFQELYTKTVPLLEQVLLIFDSAWEPKDPALPQFLTGLGRYADAQTMYKRALEINGVIKPSHPITADYQSNLAAIYQAQGNYAAAQIFINAPWKSGKKH